jgi:hypothetical protein
MSIGTQTTRQFYYSSFRDKMGRCAWKDETTKRWISRKTLMKRTGLDERHIAGFENGRDGRGYWMSEDDRTIAEMFKGVELI